MPGPAQPAAAGSRVLQFFAVLLIIVHMARPFDVVLTGLHIPMIVCGLAAIAAFTCGGLSGVNTVTGRTLAAFFAWTLLVSPFSIWKGGSASYAWQYFALLFVLVMVIAGAPSSLRQLKTLMTVLAIACTVSILWFERTGSLDGGRLSGVGEWGNAGDFALTAGFLLPFCIFVAMQIKNKLFRYIAVAVWGLFILRTTVATATRSAMLGLGCVAIVLLVRVNMMKRLGIILAGVAASVIIMATVPGAALDRLGTLTEAIGLTGGSGTGQATSDSESMGSAAERKALQADALKIIGGNFLVGVGPGQFSNYHYTYMFDAFGRHKRWFPAHNTYLQITAECGILGGLLYVCFLGSIFYTIRGTRRLNRPGSHPGWQSVDRMALCLELSLVFFIVCEAFLNCQAYAHQFVLAGMAIALERIVGIEIARAHGAEMEDLRKSFAAQNSLRNPNIVAWTV